SGQSNGFFFFSFQRQYDQYWNRWIQNRENAVLIAEFRATGRDEAVEATRAAAVAAGNALRTAEANEMQAVARFSAAIDRGDRRVLAWARADALLAKEATAVANAVELVAVMKATDAIVDAEAAHLAVQLEAAEPD
ncbi:MAG: hypothetical protein GY862_25240, partial [Gammaproteobacteria bacterium]|nr:hypothetical protein [Gammaproteobacteria bacterium]